MHIIVPLPYPRRNANNCYGPIESNSSPPSRGHSTSALNKLQQFSPSPSPTRSLPQFVSNERGSSFCPAAHVQCHPSRTRHPTPLLTHNGQKSPLGSPPVIDSISINFGNDTKLIARPLSNLSNQNRQESIPLESKYSIGWFFIRTGRGECAHRGLRSIDAANFVVFDEP